MPQNKRMSDDEVMAHLRALTPLNSARAAFSSASAQMEQAGLQRFPPAPVEVRRMEFENLERILRVAEQAGLVRILDWDAALSIPADGELVAEG